MEKEILRKEIMDAIESESELYNSEYDAIAEKIDAILDRRFGEDS
jgi:hypothetical protein